MLYYSLSIKGLYEKLLQGQGRSEKEEGFAVERAVYIFLLEQVSLLFHLHQISI